VEREWVDHYAVGLTSPRGIPLLLNAQYVPLKADPRLPSPLTPTRTSTSLRINFEGQTGALVRLKSTRNIKDSERKIELNNMII